MNDQNKRIAAPALQEAIRLAGGQSALGRALGISHTAVYHMTVRGQASHNRALQIEAATGVPRQQLRPDLYPDE